MSQAQDINLLIARCAEDETDFLSPAISSFKSEYEVSTRESSLDSLEHSPTILTRHSNNEPPNTKRTNNRRTEGESLYNEQHPEKK